MIEFKLDSNNDIVVRDGEFQLVSDADQVAQFVRTRLLFYLGEWFLDGNAGTPYLQEIFTKPTNLANIENILKRRIIDTEGIESLTSFLMDYTSGNRRLTVSFTAETIYGNISEQGVTLNV